MPITLPEVTSGYNLSLINNNFQKIESKWDEKLDRLDSSQPNYMEQELDMNSNHIINHPEPRTETDLIRLKELQDIVIDTSGVGVVPTQQDRQIGDGVTTSFNSPNLTDVSPISMFVNIDGVTQRAFTDYTITGAGTIEFTVAPPLDSEIDILYFEPNVINVKDSNVKAYESVSKMIIGNPTTAVVGDIVQVADYYGGVNPSNSGALTFKVVADNTGVADGGKYIQGTGVQFEQVMDGPFSVKQWGARPDGILSDGSANPSPTDNAPMFQAACNFLSTFAFPFPQFGKLVFPAGLNEGYATSGLTDLCECYIEGHNTPIIPIGSPDYIFKLNLRYTTNTRRFTQGWKFSGFRMWTDRGFTTTVPNPDCGHLLKIDGGWLIRSEISDLHCEPGFACRSLVDWDLTHPDIGSGVTEVGVPDANSFKNISTQYAQPTPYTLSFTGDGLGTGSRIGSTHLENIYNSSAGNHEFVTWNQSINDFGAVRIDNVKIARGDMRELFSGTHSIRMFNDALISDAELIMYVEFNSAKSSDFESILRGGTYENCSIQVTMYSENSNLQAAPRSFFTTFTNCTFKKLRYTLQSQLTNPSDENLINLGASSSGNVFENKPDFFTNPEDPGLPWILKRISAPTDTRFKFLEKYTKDRTVREVISADGTYLLGSITSDDTEINADVLAKLTLFKTAAITGSVNLLLSGDGMGNTRSSTPVSLTGITPDIDLEASFVGRSDLTSDPTPTQFSTNAMYKFVSTDDTGSTIVEAADDLNIQYSSGDYDVSLVVSGLAGGSFTISDFTLDYGYSPEYINWL